MMGSLGWGAIRESSRSRRVSKPMMPCRATRKRDDIESCRGSRWTSRKQAVHRGKKVQ